jgi:hypothetical protein
MLRNEGKVLGHLVEHIEDINEPIDNRDFIQAKEIISSMKKGKHIIGRGMFDNLEVKDIEKLEKVFEDYKIEKNRKDKNLKSIRDWTKSSTKQGVSKVSKPDIRFNKKSHKDIKDYMAYIRSHKNKK